METKTLALKRLFWKRVAKSTCKFGWHLYDATEQIETTTHVDRITGKWVDDDTVELTPHTKTSTERTVYLTFYRKKEWFKNLGSIRVLECFYNLFFWLRRCIGFLLPAVFVVGLIVSYCAARGSFGLDPSLLTRLGPIMFGTLGAWILLMGLESLFASIAKTVLKHEEGAGAALRVNSDGSFGFYEFNNRVTVAQKILYTLLTLFSMFCAMVVGIVLGQGFGESARPSFPAMEAADVWMSLLFCFSIVAMLALYVLAVIRIWKNKGAKFLFGLLATSVSFSLSFLFAAVMQLR